MLEMARGANSILILAYLTIQASSARAAQMSNVALGGRANTADNQVIFSFI